MINITFRRKRHESLLFPLVQWDFILVIHQPQSHGQPQKDSLKTTGSLGQLVSGWFWGRYFFPGRGGKVDGVAEPLPQEEGGLVRHAHRPEGGGPALPSCLHQPVSGRNRCP